MLRLITTLIVLSLIFPGEQVLALDDFETFDSDQIDVDGFLPQERTRPKPPTAADRTRKEIEKIKKQTDNLIDEKVEEKRLQAEHHIGKQLKNMFSGKNLNTENNLKVSSSPPVKQQVVPTAAPAQAKEKTLSISLLGGFSNLIVSNKNDFSDKDYVGQGSFTLELSGHVSSRIDVGVDVSYSSFKFEQNPYNFDRSYYRGPYDYYQERAILGRNLSLNLQGKFYFTTGKVRPFISGLLGYNHMTLEHDGNNTSRGQFYPYEHYGRERAYTSSYASAGAGVGLVIRFADNVGVLVQGHFKKNFAGNSKSGGDFRKSHSYQSSNYHYIDDRAILENLGEQIEDGTQFNMKVGLTAFFF